MKRLYRKKEGKKIAGVCTGLAEYFHIDPALVRILFLVAAVFWGGGILLYIIFWIAMPWQDQDGQASA